MKSEPLSLSLAKLILVATIITSIGIALLIGATGYFLTKPKIEPQVSGPVIIPVPTIEDKTADSFSEALATEDWKTYNKEKISLRYSDDIWQIRDKDFSDPSSVRTDSYFVSKKIDSCESWIGISSLGKNGYEMCDTQVLTIGGCDSDEDIVIECETPETEETERIRLNDKISAERTIWTMHTEEKIEAWYDIYDQGSNNIYCAVLFGFPDGWEECLDDFEQMLSTFRFVE